MSFIKLLAFADLLCFILRFVYWEKTEFDPVSYESLSNVYFWLRLTLWLCRAAFVLNILLVTDRRLEFVNVLGVLIFSGLIGVLGELLLLDKYMTLDWYGVLQLSLEMFILKMVDSNEEAVLRQEREKEKRHFRRDL